MNSFGLTIREFTLDQKSSWRDPQTVFFIVGLPLLYLFIFATIFGSGTSAMAGQPGAMKRTAFYVAGIIVIGVISAAFSNLAFTLVQERESGNLGQRNLSFARILGPGRCHDLGTTLRLLCHLGVCGGIRQAEWRSRLLARPCVLSAAASLKVSGGEAASFPKPRPVFTRSRVWSAGQFPGHRDVSRALGGCARAS
jgi:hypothetical protein